MSFQDLLNVLRRRPFEPFRVHISGGKSYDVQHPELVMPGLTSAIIGIPTDPSHPEAFGKTDIVSLNHIARLEPLTQATTSGEGKG